MPVSLHLDKMTVSEKFQVMESIWDDFCHRVEEVAVPDWHLDLLAERKNALLAGEESLTDWEESKERIRAFVK